MDTERTDRTPDEDTAADETSAAEEAAQRAREHPVAAAIGAEEAVDPDLIDDAEDGDDDRPRFRDTWDAEEMGNAP